MKSKKLDVAEVCKQFEDVMAPRLRLTVIERAVYWHLLRHSRVEGKNQLRFSILWLAPNIGVSDAPVRMAVRRLVEKKALRLIERSNLGHVVEVRLPDEVRTTEAPKTTADGDAKLWGMARLKKVDFLGTRGLRLAIHARERGVCFYCLKEIPKRAHCLDHVVPQAKCGLNSYRNLVSCCMECNCGKKDQRAEDFLRLLYRKGRLTSRELAGRLRALKALAAGKLRPVFQMVKGRNERGRRGYLDSGVCERAKQPSLLDPSYSASAITGRPQRKPAGHFRANPTCRNRS